MPDDLPELLTPEQVAEYLQISLTSLMRLLRRKELPGIKVGSLWRIRKERLLAYIDSQDSTEK